MDLTNSLIETLLESESNDSRFERFCCDLLSQQTGQLILPSSRGRDLGRDGRSSQRGDVVESVVAATVRETRVPAKHRSDLERLQSTTRFGAVYFVSSSSLSEMEIDELTAELQKVVGLDTRITILGRSQLRDLSVRYPHVLHRYYSLEIEELDRWLRSAPSKKPDEGEAELDALRLALTTQTGADALSVRDHMVEQLVLECSTGSGESLNGICAMIGQRLRLAASIDVAYVSGAITRLVSEGKLEQDFRSGRFRIASAGESELASAQQSSGRRILEGRYAIKEELERLVKIPIDETAFDKAWRDFEIAVAGLFYQNGQSVLSMVAGVIDKNNVVFDEQTAVLDHLADAVSRHFRQAERRDEMRVAVFDLFSDPTTKAFEWLGQIATSFVVLCTLGLEAKSFAKTNEAIRSLSLVPDTDILISLLCTAESNHAAVKAAIAGWKRLGGRIFMAEPVLKEVAHHAWIAEVDFESTMHFLAKESLTDATLYVRNAFVRSYARRAGRRVERLSWNSFINEFKGRSKNDPSKIIEILKDEFGLEEISASQRRSHTVTDRKHFEQRAKQALLKEMMAFSGKTSVDELEFEQQDKADRDARLLAGLKEAHDALAAESREAQVAVLSSARILRRVGKRLLSSKAQRDPVISMAAVGTILSLSPGTTLSAGQMQRLLFDTSFSRRLEPVSELVFRMIASSPVHRELAFSRRGTMRRLLRERLREDAERRGLKLKDMEEEFLSGKDPSHNARVIEEVAAKLGESADPGRVLQEALGEIDRLREENARLRRLQGGR